MLLNTHNYVHIRAWAHCVEWHQPTTSTDTAITFQAWPRTKTLVAALLYWYCYINIYYNKLQAETSGRQESFWTLRVSKCIRNTASLAGLQTLCSCGIQTVGSETLHIHQNEIYQPSNISSYQARPEKKPMQTKKITSDTDNKKPFKFSLQRSMDLGGGKGEALYLAWNISTW